MRPGTVAFLSVAGMLLTSVSVYSLTPPRPVGAEVGNQAVLAVSSQSPAGAGDRATFRTGTSLMLEGRLGHPRIVASGQGETLMLLEVRGADTAVATAPPLNLALVIDRSGSMRGSRLQHAIGAAVAAVDRLRDGDVVSVLAFDTKSTVVVAPTVIGPGVRERAAADIRRIALGGDTCMSCGMEDALFELERTTGKVNRMILLSDGRPTAGLRDEPAFRALARRARDRGVTVTTIGVDLGYDERILSAIAQDANGQHYFVEDDQTLTKVLETEASALAATVASEVIALVDLAPGVEMVDVLGRSFRRSGNQIQVPMGTLGRGELKTVLMRVRVPASTPGSVPVADVRLGFRDLAAGKEGACSGVLALDVVAPPAEPSPLDPVVAARLARDETAATLRAAGELFAAGHIDEANKKLDAQSQALRERTPVIANAAPADRAKGVDDDLQGQIKVIDENRNRFGTAAPASRPAKAAPKRMIETADPFNR